MGRLDGPRWKIVVANEDIDLLNYESQRFFGHNIGSAIVSGEADPQTGLYHLDPGGEVEFPPRWPVLIGEVAYNLRSALDQLVCQLALLKEPTRDHNFCVVNHATFPLFLDPETATTVKQSAKFTRGRLHYLRGEHITAIERFQPYNPGNRDAFNPLWLLHQLNNTDKHNIVVLVAKYILDPRFRLPPGTGGESLFARQREANRNSDPAGRPWEQVDMNDQPPYQVAFGDRCKAVDGFPVVSTLRSMSKSVSTVVESFAQDLA